MWLVVGLGNPGPKYTYNRHNIGFLILDEWARQENIRNEKNEQDAITCRIKVGDEDVILAKPMTFMNLSGKSVQGLMSYYKIESENLVVIHDDVDQSFNAIKLQQNRGAGGHNGLKDINQKLGHQNYTRLKFGVGRPPHPGMETADYVLQDFNKEEQVDLPDLTQHSINAIKCLITEDFSKAGTKFNKKAEIQ